MRKRIKEKPLPYYEYKERAPKVCKTCGVKFNMGEYSIIYTPVGHGMKGKAYGPFCGDRCIPRCLK